MVEVRVNGITYQQFKQVDITRDLDDFSGQGRIITTQQVNDSSFITVNDEVEILIDGIPVMKGYAEQIEDSESNNDHDISYTLRDKVCDVIDSSVPDVVKNLEDVTNFAQLCQQVITGLGMNIIVVDTVGAVFSDKVKAAQVGQKCGEFLQERARAVQVFLNTDGKGNILIQRPGTVKLLTIISNVPGASSNNVISSNVNIDYSNRFGKYTVRSNGGNKDGKVSENLNYSGTAIDTEIRQTRLFEKVAESPMDAAQCKRAAEEEANIRRIRGFSYSVQVAGFSGNGQLWDIGKLVNVFDPLKGVQGIFLIKSVTFSQTEGGEITTLSLTYPDAYLVIADPSTVSGKTTKPAGVYTVKTGDELNKIAAEFNIRLDKLIAANPQVSNPDLILPDQQIKIPTTG